MNPDKDPSGPSPAPAGASSTRSLVLRGSVWTLAGHAGTQIVRLASNIVLAKLLSPQDFGLMSLVMVLFIGLSMLSDFGVRQAIIQSPRGDEPVFLDTAWTVQIIRGLALWGLAFVFAAPYAQAYAAPELQAIVPIAALAVLLSGFNATALITANRSLKVGRLALVDVVSQVLCSIVMVVWALASPTVWALVAGMLTGNLVTLVLSHLWISDRRNRLGWDIPSLHALVGFGKWIFVSTMLWFFASQSDRLIFGRLGSIELLGVYSIAVTFAMLPAEIADRITSAIVFPAYSKVLNRGGDVGAAFHAVRAPLVVCGIAAMSLLAIAAPGLIALLYDWRYQGAAWMLQIATIGTALRLLEAPNGSMMIARGDVRRAALGHAAKLAAMPLLITAGYLAVGFPGAVAGYALSETARYAVSAWTLRGYGLQVLGADLKLVVTAIVITGLALAGEYAAANQGYGAVPATAVALAIAGCAWLIILLRAVDWRGLLRVGLART